MGNEEFSLSEDLPSKNYIDNTIPVSEPHHTSSEIISLVPVKEL